MVQRNTRQREAISRTLAEAERPLTPEEIRVRAEKNAPSLGIATVYRTMKLLQEQNEAVPVELPGQPVRYERSGLKHHHHFHCTECERVFEVEGCPVAMDHPLPKGFKVEAHELWLHGRCPSCAGS